ncbi:MAG: uncharacterized protein QG656_2062 [Candidatus Hydrogenedentes bacterium]|nr:uncharacterized protein [Candidatus Hydrogenedentota bacterium]
MGKGIVMYTLGLILFAAEMGAAPVAEDWWNPAWQYRERIHIGASSTDEALTDFPLTLRFSDAQLARAAAQADGRDLRAVDALGTVLDHEIVQWAPDAMEIVVKIPRIEAGASQYFDLYYGNPEAPALPAATVWDGHYRAVMHLTGNLLDASKGGVAAVAEGNVAIGDGVSFDGAQSGFLAIAPESLAGLGEAITIAIRFNTQPEPGAQTLASGMRAEGPEEWFNFGLKLPNIVHTNATSGGQRAPELNPEGIAPGQWHCAVIRYDAAKKTRTICIDGVVLESDSALPGPLRVDSMRIGRGMLHFDPWQFHGTIDEVRIADVARSDAWMRAEAGSLGERSPMVAIGPPQRQGDPTPPPAPFDLLAPADGMQSRKKQGETLRWRPSAGAESYAVRLYASEDAAEPAAVVDAGSATQAEIPMGAVPGAALYWTVAARSPHGETLATTVRKLSLYDWSSTMNTKPEEKTQPVLHTATQAQFDLQGYLRGRIDRGIRRYYLETPESSPAILQVLRDRDKTPVRDPLVPWAGEFAGKYLTGSELNWRLTRDPELKAVIDGFVLDLIACQEPDGYLGPFPKSSRLTGGNWDVWGHYHCMYGLMLYYEDTQYEPALDACRKAADLLFETFGPGGPTLTCDGSGGEMNMAVCHALVLLYKKTGVQRYLDLAQYIVREAWNEESAGHYFECALAGKPLIEFPRHRWESLHDWQALAELYWLTGDEQYRQAFEHIWREGLRGDRHNTGGVTSGEGFQGTPYHEGAIETCCTVAWIAFSVDMLRLTGESRVADEIEWSTLNSALGAIPYSGRACAYNVPMDGTRTFGVELPWQAPKAGPDLNCCAVNANRPLGMIAQWGLMRNAGGLVLNYYGPGEMSAVLPSGNRVALAQDTAYPRSNRIVIAVKPDSAESFPLALRIPFWSTNTVVRVNGELQAGVQPGTYLTIERAWSPGDVVELELDFTLRVWPGEEAFAGKVSLFRGPLLLAFDGRYNDLDPNALPPIDPAAVTLEPRPWEGPIEPWFLAELRDGDVSYTVCDLSSAGQTGNHYRTWLPAKPAQK